MKKRIAIFDFDKTITKTDSFNDFLIFTFGKKAFLKVIIKNCFNILLYKLKKKTNAQVKEKLFAYFYQGKQYNIFLKDCEEYDKKRLDDIIKPNILSIIKDYKDNNIDLVLLSASFREWLEPWAKKNGFSSVICSDFEKKEDEILGNIKEENSCYGKNKLIKLLKKIPDLYKKYDEVIAYGDSKSDLYYIKKATTQYIVKKDKIRLLNDYAIVTDGLWRKSVSAIRSLGKKGIRTYVLGDTRLSIGMWSKYCYKRKKIANITKELKQFENSIINIMKNSPQKPVLFPMEESTILWCTKNYKKIKNNCYILIPEYEDMKIALDKSLTIKKAQEIGVNCPKTFFPNNVDELLDIIKNEKFNDYVIKPHHGSGSAGLLYGSSSQDVDLKEHWKKYGDLIVQERIPSAGEGVGVSIIMDREHSVKGFFAHKRLEQYPNSGGPSTQRIGIKNEELVNESIRLLKSLNWIGVAMVEWKYNPKTKKYVLMEINPRFWGSLELAVRSGVDFPYLYYQLSRNRYVKEITDYRTDYNCRWLIPGDILRYLTKRKKEPLKVFLKNMIKNSEEWDSADKRGFFASIWCQGLLVINPKYWKYIRK